MAKFDKLISNFTQIEFPVLSIHLVKEVLDMSLFLNDSLLPTVAYYKTI